MTKQLELLQPKLVEKHKLRQGLFNHNTVEYIYDIKEIRVTKSEMYLMNLLPGGNVF